MRDFQIVDANLSAAMRFLAMLPARAKFAPWTAP